MLDSNRHICSNRFVAQISAVGVPNYFVYFRLSYLFVDIIRIVFLNRALVAREWYGINFVFIGLSINFQCSFKFLHLTIIKFIRMASVF